MTSVGLRSCTVQGQLLDLLLLFRMVSVVYDPRCFYLLSRAFGLSVRFHLLIAGTL
jgi:hypothetical protein